MPNSDPAAMERDPCAVDGDCRMCGKPIVTLSTDGPRVCPWCANGVNRDDVKWSGRQYRRWMAGLFPIGEA